MQDQLSETLRRHHDGLIDLLNLCAQGLARKMEIQKAFHACRTELKPHLSGDRLADRHFQRGVEQRGSYWVELTGGEFAPDSDCVKIADWARLLEEVLKLIEPGLDPHAGKNQVVLAAGDIYHAQRQILKLLLGVTSQLTIVDPYLDHVALDFVESLNPTVSIRLLVGSNSKAILPKLAAALRATLPKLELRKELTFHDRFIAIDKSEIWHLGCSLNGLGAKTSMLSKLVEPVEIKRADQLIENAWNSGISLI